MWFSYYIPCAKYRETIQEIYEIKKTRACLFFYQKQHNSCPWVFGTAAQSHSIGPLDLIKGRFLKGCSAKYFVSANKVLRILHITSFFRYTATIALLNKRCGGNQRTRREPTGRTEELNVDSNLCQLLNHHAFSTFYQVPFINNIRLFQ